MQVLSVCQPQTNNTSFEKINLKLNKSSSIMQENLQNKYVRDPRELKRELKRIDEAVASINEEVDSELEYYISDSWKFNPKGHGLTLKDLWPKDRDVYINIKDFSYGYGGKDFYHLYVDDAAMKYPVLDLDRQEGVYLPKASKYGAEAFARALADGLECANVDGDLLFQLKQLLHKQPANNALHKSNKYQADKVLKDFFDK